MLSRRELLGGAALAGANALPGAQRRPNFLFIMVDEMRWDAMGCAGHPVVKTPNLDRLAKESTRFANAYTVSPVCCPARASVFSGRHAHVHGVTMNGLPHNDGEIFLPSMLKHHGYHTAISGKLHYEPKRYSYGFDDFWSFTSEGPTPERGFNEYLRRKHGATSKWAIQPGSAPWPDDPLGRDVGVFKYPEEDFETDWITARSLEYLRARARQPQQPWFLFTSYLKPHSPSVEPKEYMEMYDPASLPVPKLPPNIRELRAKETGRGKRKYIEDEQMMRVMSAAYYGAITHIDKHVGQLLGELDKLGMADDTVVLFTADHGNMLGDRGRWFKGVMYEGSAHVPLLWRGVKGAQENNGRVENKVVDNADLLPTILETAGLTVPEGVQGRSFGKLMRGGDDRWKNVTYSQLNQGMIRDPQYKFIDNSLDGTGALELYDLRNDPKEERNLSADPKQRDRARHYVETLKKWRADRPAPVKITGMTTPDYAMVDASERKNLNENAPDRVEARRERPRRAK